MPWPKGKKRSKESIEKSALAHRGGKLSDVTKLKMSNARKGIKFTEEHKRHLRESRQRVLANPEFIRQISEKSKKAWLKPGFKEMVLSKRIDNPNILSGRQRSSEKQRGRKRPEEQCRNVSLGMKAVLLNNPEAKERRILTLRSKKRKTKIEKIVEEVLCSLGIEFYPEHRFDGVGFVDFWLPAANLVIECDGEYWHSLLEQKIKDTQRDQIHYQKNRQVIRLPERLVHSRNELLSTLGGFLHG